MGLYGRIAHQESKRPASERLTEEVSKFMKFNWKKFDESKSTLATYMWNIIKLKFNIQNLGIGGRVGQIPSLACVK